MLRPRHAALAASTGLSIAAVGIACLAALVSVEPPPPQMAWEQTAAAVDFPSHFRGKFHWVGDRSQWIAMDVENVDVVGDTVIATGAGTYITERTVQFDFRLEMDRATGDFRMWELNPSVSDWVIDGYHEGTFGPESADRGLGTWVGPYGTGYLDLTAVEHSLRTEGRVKALVSTNPAWVPDGHGGALLEFAGRGDSEDCIESLQDEVMVRTTISDDKFEFRPEEKSASGEFRLENFIEGRQLAMMGVCSGDYVKTTVSHESGEFQLDMQILDVRQR